MIIIIKIIEIMVNINSNINLMIKEIEIRDMDREIIMTDLIMTTSLDSLINKGINQYKRKIFINHHINNNNK